MRYQEILIEAPEKTYDEMTMDELYDNYDMWKDLQMRYENDAKETWKWKDKPAALELFQEQFDKINAKVKEITDVMRAKKMDPNAIVMGFVNKIVRDCQPYLGQVSNPLAMYRGMDIEEGSMIQSVVPLNSRTPRGMSEQMYMALNHEFTEEFGEPFRNAAFCTGDLDHTEVFGDTAVVFPIGIFTFLWSERVEDMNYEISDFEMELTDEDYDAEFDVFEFIDQRVAGRYTDENLDAAVKSGNEIMIRSQSYYAMDYKFAMRYKRIILEGLNQ